MITEDYVSFETAKLLKEKGFDEPCYMWCFNPNVVDKNGIPAPPQYYGQDVVLEHGNYYKNSEQNIKDTYAAPTLQMAMKWVRKTYNLSIEPYRTACGYLYIISTIPYGSCKCNPKEGGDDEDSGQWTTYEGACEAAIKYCFEKLI